MIEDKKVPIQDIIDKFSLEIVAGGESIEDKNITVSEIKRPGIELAGFWDHFSPERVQLLGMTEISFLNELSQNVLQKRVKKLMSYNLNCVIISRNLDIPQIVVEKGKENQIPLLRTPTATTRFISHLTNFLERKLAPQKVIHGVLVDIYSIGVLIKGESGIGKSETAIELVKRGHRLVADDLIIVKKIGEEELYGYAPEKSRHFLEMRGIGIINVRSLFGAGAVKDDVPIQMITTLKRWNEIENYDRLGLDSVSTELLDVLVPEIIIPVKPGRNLALVLEVAAMNMRMKSMGYNAARDFVDRTRPREK